MQRNTIQVHGWEVCNKKTQEDLGDVLSRANKLIHPFTTYSQFSDSKL